MSYDYLQKADARSLGYHGNQWNQESPWSKPDDEPVPDWLKPQPETQTQTQPNYPQPNYPQYQNQQYQQLQNQPYRPYQPYQTQKPTDVKSFLRSKTVWAGIVTSLASVCSYFQGSGAIQANPQATSAFGIGIGVLMVLLRLLSSKTVSPPRVIIPNSKPPGWPK